MELKGKKVLVIGLARTGRECARFLVDEGANVTVSDRGSDELTDEIKSLAGLPIRYFFGAEEREWSTASTASSRVRACRGKSAAQRSRGKWYSGAQ